MKNELKKWRKARGLKQKDIARLLGCATSQISHYETGRHTMPAEKAVLLARLTATDAGVFRPDVFGKPKKRLEAA